MPTYEAISLLVQLSISLTAGLTLNCNYCRPFK